MNLQEQRLEILEQIDKLVAIHPKPNSKSGVCSIKNCVVCGQLKELGAKYEYLTISKRMEGKTASLDRDLEKMKLSIISKGMDATKSEIQFLIEMLNISKKEVARLIGMNENQFLAVCRNWNIGLIYRRTGA